MKREELLNTIINSTYYKENPNLRIYIDDIKNYKEDSNEMIKDFVIKAQNGDKEAIERIYSHYQMTVLQYAFKYVNEDIDIMDLIQAGNEGIYNSLKLFNFNIQSGFSTYTINNILHEMDKEANNQQFIKKHGYEIPNRYQTFITAYYKAKKILGHEPSKEEMISLTNASKLATNKYYSLPIVVMSFNNNFSKSEKQEIDDLSVISYFLNNQYIEDNHGFVNNLLSSLSDKRKTIVELYFGLNGNYPHKTKEIADRLGYSYQYIAKEIHNSIKQMRKEIEELSPELSLKSKNKNKAEKQTNNTSQFYIPQDYGKTLFDVLKKYAQNNIEYEDVMDVLATLEKKYMKILVKKFGKDLNGEASSRLTKQEDESFYNVILTVILFRACIIKKNRLEQEKQEFQKQTNIIEDEKVELIRFLSSEVFETKSKDLDIVKVFIIKLKFGLVNGEEYSEENIAYFLKVSKSYIYECVKEIVTLCNNLNNNKFGNYLAYYENEKETAKEKGIKL